MKKLLPIIAAAAMTSACVAPNGLIDGPRTLAAIGGTILLGAAIDGASVHPAPPRVSTRTTTTTTTRCTTTTYNNGRSYENCRSY